MAQTNDIFAQVAVERYEARNRHLVAPEPVPVPKRTLPLDKKAGVNAFEPLPKLSTAAELRVELEKARKQMAEFLADVAPPLDATRLSVSLEESDWREETEADRRDFAATLAGGGEWQRVKIPHFGPPLGRAVTYYRVNFEVTEEMRRKGALFVAFDAVDYRAHVFVNNAFLGSHEGFFAPFEFDFTPHARVGENTLLVKVENDHIFMGSSNGTTADIDGDKMYAATGLGYDDPERGWHHCPPGMGICQGVRIEARSRLFISDLFIRPLAEENRAEAWVEVSNCDVSDAPISFELSLFGQNFSATVFRHRRVEVTTSQIAGYGDLDKKLQQVIAKPAGSGVSQYRIPVEISNVRKWDLNTPWLYQLQVKLCNKAGEVCDVRKQQFGMRSFRQDENSKPKGKFYLNGQEIRLRGANTMGHEQMCVFRKDWNQLVDDILLAKLCNMNFLRLTQRPVQREVYEYCSRLGLMTQTDLPLFGVLRRNKLCEAVRQAEEMERLVRPHPCNILISYINEPFPNGMSRPHRNLTRHEMNEFFDMASRAVRLSNPDRVIKCVDGDYDPPAPFGMPDNHCYCGWYIGSGIDLGRLNRGDWLAVADGWHYGCGEFGSEGLDNLEVMRKFYPDGWLPAAGQKQALPWRPDKIALNQTNRFQYLWYPHQTTPEAWIEASQRHQAWVTRLMTEAFRRDARMNTFAIHLFIDAWPCGWMKTIMDVLRNPKKAYFAYRDALTPLMVSLRTDRRAYHAGESVEMEAWICNDNHSAPSGAQLRYQIEIDGRVIQSGHAPAKVPLCSSKPQGRIRFKPPQCEQRTLAIVRLALTDKSGRVLVDTSQEVELFPQLPPLNGQRAFVIGRRTGLAASLANELGLTAVFSGTPGANDVILIDDLAKYAAQESIVLKQVESGGTAVFLELPAGQHKLGNDIVKVVPGGMGHRHFADCSTGHELVADCQPYDFWFWHDEAVGYATPLLSTVLDPAPTGWSTVLESGNGSWRDQWKPVPAVVEKDLGEGVLRICQVKLVNRTKTNPTAAAFACRLLSLDCQMASGPRDNLRIPREAKAVNGVAMTDVASVVALHAKARSSVPQV